MTASPKSPALDTVPGAPPWIADTTPDPHPPDMSSASALPRETGSMPCAEEQRSFALPLPSPPPPAALPLADSHGWRLPRSVPLPRAASSPERRTRLERSVVAPAAERPRPRQLAVSWRAVGAFALGAAVTALATAVLEGGMSHVLALTCVLVGALWFLVCIERR